MRISLVPDGVYESYQQITPELLQSRGIRLLLSDLDYTLAPKSVSRPDQAVRDWLSRLQAAGIRVMILSNNRSPRRVPRAGDHLCGPRQKAADGGLSPGHGPGGDRPRPHGHAGR